jgi:putative ABC transport system permease protein
MPENYDTKQFYNKFPAFYEKHAAKMGKALNQEYKAVIQPLLDIHFSKEWSYDLPNGNKTYILAFLIIGVLVLLLSGINYLNLTTARSERRRREISIKKILGSKSSGLIFQFLGESMLMSVIAMLAALLMTWFILGFTSFDQLIEKDMKVEIAKNPSLVIGVIILTIFVGIGSGIYPACYLSNIHPLRSLQKFYRSGIFAFSLRKLLVIMQLVISIGVVIFTLMTDHQIKYLGRIDIGINKENLLIIPLRDTAMTNHFNSFRDKLMLNPSVESVTSAHNVPADGTGNNLYRAETENGLEENNFYSMWVSYEFINTLGIKLLSGRNFSRDFSSDYRSSFIINETLAKRMGWKEPLGKRLQQNFGSEGIPYFDGAVIGVVSDFNYASLHNAIEPLVLRLQSQESGRLLVKLDGNNMKKNMSYIEELWNEYSDEFPTDYTFLDKNYEMLYKKDNQQNMLVKIFSWICILISVMGLISLASYITKNRTREIAIRKIYGASAGLITKMLFKEILVLVLVSSVIASPLAYFFAEKVLNNFAYKAPLNINIFLITVAGALVLVLGTVSYHSLKAAWMNPARSLRYE